MDAVRWQVELLHGSKPQVGGLSPAIWHSPPAALLNGQVVVIAGAILVGGGHNPTPIQLSRPIVHVRKGSIEHLQRQQMH